MMTSAVRRFTPSVIVQLLRSEAAGGIVLMVTAALAMLVANSGVAQGYFHALHAPLGPTLTDKLGPMTAHLWINDGLMAVFFLYVGLEIKRELIDGGLATWEQRRLPVVAAIGGIVVPAAMFFLVTRDAPEVSAGWAIPAATDIAFAVGVLSLLGKRVPVSLKLFLVTVAIVDDLAAILIIALVYTASIKLSALAAAAVVVAAMVALNRFGVRHWTVYAAGFALLWYAMLLSGVHATIAGVLAAFTVPIIRTPGTEDDPDSTLHVMEHALAKPVAFGIVPIFGFANAGVALGGLSLAEAFAPLPLGIAAGLFLGKQLGIFGAVWLAVKSGFAGKPRGATWRQIHGVTVVCGIGFTMSLFIGGLAFRDPLLIDEAKIGTLAGSLLSALVGLALLRTAPLHPAQLAVDAEIEKELEADGDADREDDPGAAR